MSSGRRDVSGTTREPAQAERSGASASPRLYSDLAAWWPLLSPPSHYVLEAADLLPEMLGATTPPPATLLELGSGGGSLAWHLKKSLRLTLSDRSPEMLAVSGSVNPECEHVLGDMRELDLSRTFDVVLVHDAIMYMTDADSVRAALATASRHCRKGGAVFVVPDYVRETFQPETECGGEDHPDGRGLRYLEWTWDPDPSDDTFETAYAFLLRQANGTVTSDFDLHREGVFARAAWLAWLEEAGLTARTRIDPWARDVFSGRKR